MAKVGLLAIHGMGETERGFSSELISDLKKEMGSNYNDMVVFNEVYYQHILQDNENEVWRKLAKKLRWDGLRKFLLFGFADAAGLEHRKELENSAYEQAQLVIAQQLYQTYTSLHAQDKTVILAHSLGCQVISCYLWDAALSKTGPAAVHAGIWKNIQHYAQHISGHAELTEQEIAFLRGERLALLATTGCNIPIFVAAHKKIAIKPFAKPNQSFIWHNYYDKDDVLGWPLAELSDEYAALVQDIKINAGGGVWGWISKSWNPMSHGEYWEDKEFLEPFSKQLAAIAQHQSIN